MTNNTNSNHQPEQPPEIRPFQPGRPPQPKQNTEEPQPKRSAEEPQPKRSAEESQPKRSAEEPRTRRRQTPTGTVIIDRENITPSAVSRREREAAALDQSLADLSPEDQRRYRRELKRLRRSLRTHTSGKPTRPATDISLPGQIVHILGRTVGFTVLAIVLGLILVFGIGGGMLLGYYATMDPIDPALLSVGSQTTTMYDSRGDIISKSTGSQNIDRIYVPYSEIEHTYIDDAFIATEDERFDTNIGIDPRRIASAVVSALANGGTATHGGSTITQQTVKLLTGDNEISAQRKVQEWFQAIRLKQQLTNDEIMELYLNLVPMGNSYVGIESAAQAYFAKEAKDLTLEESAFLAGIPKGPSIYNPRTETGLRNALRRQRTILAKMHEQLMITDQQYEDALNHELVFRQTPQEVSGTSINSYFAEYVYDQALNDLVSEKGYTTEMARNLLYTGGLNIYTTLDPDIQAQVDETFNKIELFALQPELYDGLPALPQAGMAIVENRTGAVVAMGGGMGEKTANLVTNRAADIERQPGSSIKPLVAYGPAIDMGKITGATMINDEEVFMNPYAPNEPWPTNFYDGYFGWMTVRNSLKLSNNVPAVKILNMVGTDNARYYLDRVGIDRMQDEAQLSMAVGAFQQGMSPLEMASAFTVFANNGLYTPVYAYTRIEDRQGRVILENTPSFEQVYKPESAYMMTRIMEETVTGLTSAFPHYGGASRWGMIQNANGETISTAGKTGTTDNNVDKWFVGITPYYSAATWYGLDVPRDLPEIDMYQARAIWFDVMDNIHLDLPAAQWEQPGNIIALEICIESGLLATSDCYAANPGNVMTEYFVQGSPLTPTSTCTVHKPAPLPSPAETEADEAEADAETPDNAG